MLHWQDGKMLFLLKYGTTDDLKNAIGKEVSFSEEKSFYFFSVDCEKSTLFQRYTMKQGVVLRSGNMSSTDML